MATDKRGRKKGTEGPLKVSDVMINALYWFTNSHRFAYRTLFLTELRLYANTRTLRAMLQKGLLVPKEVFDGHTITVELSDRAKAIAKNLRLAPPLHIEMIDPSLHARLIREWPQTTLNFAKSSKKGAKNKRF